MLLQDDHNSNRIIAVILAGRRDFGRCPLVSRWPLALWPRDGKPALQHILDRLSREGIKQAVICHSEDDTVIRDAIHIPENMAIQYLTEHFPLGTGGCLRNAAFGYENTTIIFLPANMLTPPDLSSLLAEHRRQHAGLTIVLNPSTPGNQNQGELSGIYLCDPKVIQYIPPEGYCDIKETLIPRLLQEQQIVHTIRLAHSAGNFRTWMDYLAACLGYLEEGDEPKANSPAASRSPATRPRISPTAVIDPSAIIRGPVVIHEGAQIGPDAVLLGPAIIGDGVKVGRGCLVADSVLLNHASLGNYCQVQNSLIGYDAVVQDEAIIRNASDLGKNSPINVKAADRSQKAGNNFISKQSWFKRFGRQRADIVPYQAVLRSQSHVFVAIQMLLLFIALIWSYWPAVLDLWQVWMRSDEYSCGLLVPFIAVYILWTRRHDIVEIPLQPSLWGVGLFLAAQALRYLGLFFTYGSAEKVSLLLSIGAVILLLFGSQFFKRVVFVWLFLFLMLPLPAGVRLAVSLPLQNWATSSAVFFLEVMGFNVVVEGNIISLGNTTVAVAEACNGLRMVTAFFVVSGMVVLLSRRRMWEKMIVIIMTLPIALFCNTIRLCLTTLVFTQVTGERWEKLFHDFGGYAMIPLALGIVAVELWILQKLVPITPLAPTNK
jgi:exosortase